MEVRLALLRGINVAGKKKVPMADLRSIAEDLGFGQVSTYIASGNLLYASEEPIEHDTAALEAAISEHFGFEVDVIIRTRSRWLELAEGGAFPQAEQEREKFLHLAMSKEPPAADAPQKLAKYLAAAEDVAFIADGLWIDYANGVGRSKITPAALDRSVGSTVTARNFRSVKKLAELLRDKP